MPPQTFYCLDSNVYIEAGKDYYSFDLCDSFWQHLVHHSGGRVVSIDRVKAELTVHNNKLGQWVAGPCSAAFASTNRPEVIHWYGQIQQWAHSRDFTPAALNKFGTVADAWLVAFAKATGRTVVTHEGWDQPF